MSVRKEVIPFLIASLIAGGLLGGVLVLFNDNPTASFCSGLLFFVIMSGYFLYFFRDPARTPPDDPSLILSGADGVVAVIKDMEEKDYMKCDTVRVSVFLSLFDVHVNRAPITGKSRFLGYFKGKHFFTFEEKSSDHNQHNAILITGRTRCLVRQIVGPVCRRVVYWPSHDEDVALKMGDPIGMMKFGSRMDMYFPKNEVEITAKVGDRVHAGLSVIGRIKGGDSQ